MFFNNIVTNESRISAFRVRSPLWLSFQNKQSKIIFTVPKIPVEAKFFIVIRQTFQIVAHFNIPVSRT